MLAIVKFKIVAINLGEHPREFWIKVAKVHRKLKVTGQRFKKIFLRVFQLVSKGCGSIIIGGINGKAKKYKNG